MRFRKRYSVLCLLAVAVLLFNACTKEDNLQTRHFRMGFAPVPEELASNELQYAYSKLAAQADIVNYNLDGGVPWQESLDCKDYNSGILADWNFRRQQATPGQQIYVSVTPLNTFRNGLANYRGPSPNMTLAPPWNGYSFNAAPVKEAYLNYCRRVIDFFQPDYFAMGIETNLLYLFRPEAWTDYLDLQEYVYKELKRSYPTLPVFSSISGAPVLNNFIQNIDHVQQKLAALQVLEYSDYFAVSFYPGHGVFDVKRHSGDIFDELFSLSMKPMVVAETGYSAETFSMKAGKGFSPFAIDPVAQQEFVNNLLIASERWRAGFVIWSTLRGYNQLFGGISATPGQNVASRKSGFYDRAGIPGSALSPWTEWMKRKIAH